MAVIRYKNSDGYVVISELEHRHIAKQVLQRELKSNEIVHHINGVKTDNDVRNLCVMDREKHEHFHSWLDWKKEKSGSYPSINDQKRILVSEYGGELLENIDGSKDRKNILIDKDEADINQEHETKFDNLEKFVVRRNKNTKRAFIEFDEEILISPEGKEIAIDLERFSDIEDAFESELTDKQIQVYRNKVNHHDRPAVLDEHQLELQKILFNELRKVRKRIADEENIPVYLIFNNKTLIEMSEIMPESENLMLQIRGVGSYKFQKYGAAFIKVIKDFKIDKNAA